MLGKKKTPPKKNDGWVVSFGATMTIMLAFFITLQTLAQDQTGSNLYAGTGSFIRSLRSFGLPGLFDGTSRPWQGLGRSPSYSLQESESDGAAKGPGTHESGNSLRIIDLEREQFDRFLKEMNERFSVTTLTVTSGHTVFDFYEPLRASPPYLTAKHHEVLDLIRPLLAQQHYRVFLVVWATMPSEKAWLHATTLARLAAEEYARTVRLGPERRARLIPEGRTWGQKKQRRPVMSLIVTKMRPGD